MSASRLKELWGVAFEKAVRRKPLARWMRGLCKLNGARGCRSARESSRQVEKPPVCLCEHESRAVVRRGGGGNKTLGCNVDTHRRDALKRGQCGVWASDFMQPWPGAVENGVGVVPL